MLDDYESRSPPPVRGPCRRDGACIPPRFLRTRPDQRRTDRCSFHLPDFNRVERMYREYAILQLNRAAWTANLSPSIITSF